MSARSPPPDGVPQRPLRRVVRRLDPPHPEEGPQVLLARQQPPARRLRLLAGARHTPAQGLPDVPPDRPGVAQEGAPGHLPVTVLVPPVEQPVRGPEQFRTDRRPHVTAIDHRLKISAKMRPAVLMLLDPVIAGEPI